MCEKTMNRMEKRRVNYIKRRGIRKAKKIKEDKGIVEK